MNQPKAKQENFFLNLLLNIILPTIILTKFSGDDYLGVKLGLIVALSFPICYGIYDFQRARKLNIFSIIGFISVLLTGGISLLELDPKYIAIKEAAIPGILAIAVIISIFTPYPLIRILIYNEKIFHVDKVTQALDKNGSRSEFERSMIVATFIIALSFIVSSVLNYVLATMIVVSQPGTEAFNVELGKLTAYSYLVIFVPSISILIFAMFYIYRRITKLTGLSFEEMLAIETTEKPKQD